MRNLGFILLLIKLGGKVGPALIKLIKTAKVAKAGLALGSMAAYSYMFTKVLAKSSFIHVGVES